MAFYSTSRDIVGVDKITIRQKFGARVRELRSAYGLSQEAFADQCGFARSYMSRVERGRANPSLEAIQIIADALGLAISELFNEAAIDQVVHTPEKILVPQASDGSCFGPHLKKAGKFTVGEKEDEVQFENFDEALAYLRRMGTAKWRRPNANGNAGIVSAVRWIAQKN